MRKSTLTAICLAFGIATAIGSIASAAHAAIGYRFLPKEVTREQIIEYTDASIHRDPTGHSPLMIERCVQEHDRDACATPYDYYTFYRVHDPDPILTDDVQSILPYFQSLADGAAPTDGEYLMACLTPTATPNKYHLLDTCDHRAFLKGEMVSYNPRTKRIVLAWNCKNPVVGKWDVTVVMPPCAYINVGTHHGGTLRFGALIPPGTNLEDSKHCLAVKMPGTAKFVTWEDHCPNQRCDYQKYEGMTGLTIAAFGSEKSAGGDVILRVPSYFARKGELSIVMLCLTEEDGRQACAKKVPSENYYLRHDDPGAAPDAPGTNHAYVRYAGEGSPDPMAINWHWDLTNNCPTF